MTFAKKCCIIAVKEVIYCDDRELETIRSRCEKANVGKWVTYIEDMDIECGSSFIQTSGNDLEITNNTVADYDFITHTKQDIITLLDKIEKLHSQL